MATPFRLKRSAVANKRPGLTDLQLGELALNTYDGRLFAERDTGGVGIGTTIALLTPFTENYGGGSIYYNDGSVGIGTTNPTGKFEVFGGRIVGAATSNVIPFLYSDYSDLPSASSYHGAFAHVHSAGKGFFAHAGNWIEIVSKETNGTVGSGTERYNVGPTDLTTLNVSGISTFTGDVSFGSTATFGDNDKLKFGDDDDLEIFHNSSNGNTIIQETTGGNLVIKGSNLFLQSSSGEDFFKGEADGAVTLYYNDVAKFETSGIGVTITGETDINGDLNVSGVSTLTGNVSFGSSALFGDGDTILMGDGDDLQIFHSGITGNIKNTTGTLILQSSTVRIQDGGSSETAFSASDGVAQLYYKNSKKLETNGIGITVYNQLDATNLNISGVSTFTGAVDLNAGLDIDGQLDVDELVVAGVSTFNAAVDIDAGLDVDGQTDLDELVVAGVSTFNAAVDIDSTLDVDGDTQLDDLNVAGVATFSSLVDANNRLDVAGGANLDQLNVAGVSTFGGVSTFNDDVRITAGGLDVVGVATFSTNVNVTGTLDAGLIDGGTY